MKPMNKLFFFLILFSVAFIPSTHAQVKIKGNLKFSDPVKMVFLSYSNAGGSVKDSSKLSHGKFQFNAKITEPTAAYLSIHFEPVEGQAKPRTESKEIFLEPGKMKIEAKDSLKFATITGSRSQKEFETFNALLKPYQERAQEIVTRTREYRARKDSVEMKKSNADYDKLIVDIIDNLYLRYLSENTTSPIALYELGQLNVTRQLGANDLTEIKIESLFENLPAAARTSVSGTAFKEQIETAKKTMVGAYAMDFTQNDTLGKPVSLSSFKGKYLLVDLWASWCGPCRKENPNYVSAFNTYNNKAFTILSVSLDQPGKQQAWLDAIHKDALTWTQVSDLKFWDNAVAKQYGVRAIPFNLLLDPTGKIIAKNIRGEELQNKLKEIFTN